MLAGHDPAAEKEKHWVALTSLLAAVGITGFKVIVGVATGSLGILAEAAHSGLDLVAALVTFLAIRAAGRPPDAEHLYGHGKVENLSALFETLLLLLTCVWIFHGAIKRLVFQEVEIEVNFWSFAAMITSIVVDYSRSRALSRAAKKHKSQALEADALHFETDIWSSIAVIGGLVCVRIAQTRPALAWLEHADAIAALVVAGIVVWVSIQLGLRTVHTLLDSAPRGMQSQVVEAAEGVSGVSDCHKVRVRVSGPRLFVDVHVRVDGTQTLDQAHELTREVERAIQRISPGADVTVHAEPRRAASSVAAS